MSKPTEPAGEVAPPAVDEDQAIRKRVRELTSQVLQQGHIDTQGVRDVVRAMAGFGAANPEVASADARQVLADAVRDLDAALLQSVNATHLALERVASRGKDFTNNDLKETLLCLKKLEEDYVAVATRVADALSGNLRRELTGLAAHAQSVGADASGRVATVVGEFAGRMGENANSGLATMRGTSMRMALLASGVLAGVADALRDQSEAKNGK